jgi:hypothetical protein
MPSGWIKLWRSIEESDEWRLLNGDQTRVLITVLVNADYETGVVKMGTRDMAKKSMVGRQTVRSALKRLVNTGFLIGVYSPQPKNQPVSPTRELVSYLVNNWEKYQETPNNPTRGPNPEPNPVSIYKKIRIYNNHSSKKPSSSSAIPVQQEKKNSNSSESGTQSQKASSADIKTVRAAWERAWKRHTGVDAVFSQAEYVAARNLLKRHSANDIAGWLDDYLQIDDKYLREHGYPLSLLGRKVNAIKLHQSSKLKSPGFVPFPEGE